MSSRNLRSFKSAAEYIEWYRSHPEEKFVDKSGWNFDASHEEKLISAFENNTCAVCGGSAIPEFHSYTPDHIARELFDDEPRFWYEATCPNGHYVEASADKDGCITE